MPTRETAVNGAPCWVDLMTSDTARSRDFYTQLFGWSAEEPAEEFGGYFNFTKDGVRVAGCMASQPDSGLPDLWSVYLASADARKTLDVAGEGVPAHWSVYFGADDTDAALAKVTDLGGSILRAPEDTPYGRLVTAADPTGAVFKLVAPNAAMPARDSTG